MPNMADQVVKKADLVTNITYVGLNPSSGDGVPARWRIDAGYNYASQKPWFQMSSRFNGPKTARRVDMYGVWPTYSLDVNSFPTITGGAIFTGSWLVPLNMLDTQIAEAVTQFGGMQTTTLSMACIKAGYAPT
jgi:hypothetical protein